MASWEPSIRRDVREPSFNKAPGTEVSKALEGVAAIAALDGADHNGHELNGLSRYPPRALQSAMISCHQFSTWLSGWNHLLLNQRIFHLISIADIVQNPRVVLQHQLRSGLDFLDHMITAFHESDQDLFGYSPAEGSRSVAEILLHIIRSVEYYLTGVVEDTWEFLPYTTETHDTFEKIKDQASSTRSKVLHMIEELSGDRLHHLYTQLEKPAFGLSLMIELLYHQMEHFGQLQVYLRINGIEPPTYPFLI
ncbi:MAG: DinB family protein [Candidatus Kariarchaeaceae archaeon]